MKIICNPAPLKGDVEIPGSKSHTIRAVAFASLAAGESEIRSPLESADTLSAVSAFRALGAEIETESGLWRIKGFGGEPKAPDNVIDIGNSGTSMRLAMGACGLLREGSAVLTGDEQIRRRPAGPLARAMSDLGAKGFSTRNNDCAPFVIEGRLRGGRASIEAVTSQYLSSLLISCPLGDGDTDLDVPVLNERPYVGITLDWLEQLGIRLEHDDEMKAFHIPGGQSYKAFSKRISADFSSATFFLCAGALTDCDVTSKGLDLSDPQGDKAVVEYLIQMGADVEKGEDGIRVRPGDLRGVEIDMNATPDALPMMAVLGCFARGRTRLVNVPQARIKETDRIAVMAAELSKMGAKIEELPDGLIIDESRLRGARLQGHFDHRVVMALAVAASLAEGETTIDSAEAVQITFPTFVECMSALGAKISLAQDKA